jgi:hypothetical protein
MVLLSYKLCKTRIQDDTFLGSREVYSPGVPTVKDFKVSQSIVEDYVTFLHNKIAFARECLMKSQAYNADHATSKCYV